MALGNRPKGSKIGYTLAFVIFAVSEYHTPSPNPSQSWLPFLNLAMLTFRPLSSRAVTLYMTFAAFWITYKSILIMKAENGGSFNIGHLFKNLAFVQSKYLDPPSFLRSFMS